MSTSTPVQTGSDASTPSRLSIPNRLLAAAGLAAVMVLGIFVLGRVATDDLMAMVLTSIFFLAVAAGLAWLIWRRRELLLPLGLTYVLVAGTAGVLLGLPLITDDVVEEDVVRVESTEASGDADAASGDAAQQDAGSESAQDTSTTGPTEIASGQFEARVHPGEGTATLIDTAEGSTVLTLTDFATDNGPDLLVYLVPADAPDGSIDGFVDLGPLRGNIGDQQYEVPSDVDAGEGWRVVIWCRAFAVNFTEATLG